MALEKRKEEQMTLRMLSQMVVIFLTGIVVFGSETHLIQFSPTKGDVQIYENKVVVKQKAAILPGGEAREDIKMNMKQTVLEVRPDGSSVMEVVLLKMQKTENGVVDDLDFSLLGKPIMVELNKHGHAVKVHQPPDLDQASKIVFSSMKQGFFMERFDFPPEPVEIGYSWEAPFTNSLESNGVVEDYLGTKHYKFLGIKTINEKVCYEIKVKAVFDVIREHGEGGVLKAETNTVLLLDKTSGIARKATIDQSVKGEIQTPRGLLAIEIKTHIVADEMNPVRGN